MDNPINQDTVDAIMALFKLNWSHRKITRALRVSRKKVGKILTNTHHALEPVQDSIKINKDYTSLTQICRHCECEFELDPRHRSRQKFCSRAECRQASKRESQKQWVQKNSDYWI